MPVWINNSRVGRILAQILGNQAERLSFAISKLISVVVPLDMLAYQPLEITIPATAGNVAFSFSPNKGHRVKIYYAKLTLVADATVKSRYICWKITNAAGTDLTVLGVSGAVAASETKGMSVNHVLGGTDASDAFIHITDGFEVWDDDIVNIAIWDGQAGDSWSGKVKIGWM